MYRFSKAGEDERGILKCMVMGIVFDIVDTMRTATSCHMWVHASCMHFPANLAHSTPPNDSKCDFERHPRTLTLFSRVRTVASSTSKLSSNKIEKRCPEGFSTDAREDSRHAWSSQAVWSPMFAGRLEGSECLD